MYNISSTNIEREGEREIHMYVDIIGKHQSFFYTIY